MSSCAASCSTCCHAASCASATSASSPTGNAPRSCRSASNCSTAHRNISAYASHRRPRSASLAMELSALRRNHARCRTALRRSTPAPLSASTRALRQHESLSTSSASAPAPARTQIRCLVEPGVLCHLFFPAYAERLSCNASPLHHDRNAPDPTHHSGLLEPLHPLSPIQST